MTRSEVIRLMEKCPYCKVTHRLFSPNEYLYAKENGDVYTEEGYLFEDWGKTHSHDGMRMRVGDEWMDGWECISIMNHVPSNHLWFSKDVFPETENDPIGSWLFSVDVVGYDGSKYFKAYYSFTDHVWFNGEIEEEIDNLFMWAYGPDIESK